MEGWHQIVKMAQFNELQVCLGGEWSVVEGWH